MPGASDILMPKAGFMWCERWAGSGQEADRASPTDRLARLMANSSARMIAAAASDAIAQNRRAAAERVEQQKAQRELDREVKASGLLDTTSSTRRRSVRVMRLLGELVRCHRVVAALSHLSTLWT